MSNARKEYPMMSGEALQAIRNVFPEIPPQCCRCEIVIETGKPVQIAVDFFPGKTEKK